MKYLIALIVCLSSLSAMADIELESSKLTIRTGVESYVNKGTQAGQSSGFGGFDLQYIVFLNSYLAAGIGYGAQFDLQAGGVPVAGMELVGRYYFWKEGTQVSYQEKWGELSLHNSWTPYAMTMYSQRKFYLGNDYESTDTTKSLAGEYSIINVGIGLDYRLSRRFEFNAEFSTSAYAFVATDPRVKINETALLFGVNYVF
jgi:hypothetical protein